MICLLGSNPLRCSTSLSAQTLHTAPPLTGAATPLRDNAWSGGRTPMHPSMEDGDDAFDSNHPPQRGGFAGTPYRPDGDYSRQVGGQNRLH